MKIRHLFPRLGALALAALFLVAPMPKSQALELLMFRQAYCEACTLWDQEVGVIYEKTSQGRQAPLRNIDIHRERPRELAEIKAVIYTPTFVLVDRGKEIGRIVGYGGEDFFWGLLDDLLGQVPESEMRVELETAVERN